MFQFPGFPSYTYVFSVWSMSLQHRGFPIRKSAGQSLFAALRSLSQLVTSFFGSWCQGILPVLFLAWSHLCELFENFRSLEKLYYYPLNRKTNNLIFFTHHCFALFNFQIAKRAALPMSHSQWVVHKCMRRTGLLFLCETKSLLKEK